MTLTPAAMTILSDIIPLVVRQRWQFYPSPSMEDLEAELWLACVEESDWVENNTDNSEALKSWLRQVARRIQKSEERTYRAERAYASGYQPIDECFYSLTALRHLIPAYLDGGISEHPPKGRVEQGPIGHTDGSEYGNWLVMMADIDQALKEIPEGQSRLLQRYFAYPQGRSGWTHLEISAAMGQEPEALTGRVRRALRAVQRVLGGPDPAR